MVVVAREKMFAIIAVIGDMWNSCLTREQAIEKMAKAMCRKSNGGTCDGCSVFEEPDKERCKEIYMHPEFVDGAEAALNALLEVNNEDTI